ncbi:hypothetical protein ACFPMF_11140 [Larkinella bovis]|uniref:DUF4905 domain-containing protein n=1 Tax=Larkinella bovis TaxID=683041 RepID=A0ABW0I9C0_9BACT
MSQNQLPIAFQLSFSESVWRLIFEQVDLAPPRFVAELRSHETQRLTYVTAELPPGTLLSQIQPAVPFHSALVGLWNGLALYHRFDNNRLPVPTALGAVDPKTGQIRWEWPQHTLKAANAELVWAQRASLTDTTLSPVVVFRLSDGEPVETAIKPPAGHNSRLQFPVSYTTSSPWWPVIDRFLKKMGQIQPIESVDYLEVADKLIFSYYYREPNDRLRSSLLITDRRQTIWLHQPTGPGIETTGLPSDASARPLVGTGSFCVWQNQLITQLNSTCITSYFLTPTP